MKVIITDCDHAHIDIEKKVLDKARLNYSLQQNLTEEDVIANCQDAEILINQYAPITKKVIEALPNLKVVIRYGVGVNNVDLVAATDNGVQVCNVPDYGTHEVADHALALMLALTRKINIMTTDVKNGQWNYQNSMKINRHSEQIIGVIGVGRIGRAFSEKVRALGCKILAYDPSEKVKKLKEQYDFIEFVSFEDVLINSDVISIHCPSENAHHLFDKEALSKMKCTAYLVNVSRGGIIDEAALLEALQNKQIAGAALDVFSEEPISSSHPLLKFDNFLLTPHMAWYSEQAAEELKRKVAEEAVRYVNGKNVHYPVNTI